MGLFDRLKRGLEKTKEVLRTDVRDLFKAGWMTRKLNSLRPV